jgi:transcriptional regulator with XRE-family HTH domain
MSIKHSAVSLGEFLRVHRLGEELSQVEFAKFRGISKQRLCDIEHARFAVSIKQAKELARKLDLPPGWLVKHVLTFSSAQPVFFSHTVGPHLSTHPLAASAH